MVAVLTFLKENPQAWGPIGTLLAALTAVAGVVFSLRGQAAASQRQREYELRRTELFKLIEDAALGTQVINEAGVLEKTPSELSRMRATVMVSHTRAMCFADPRTIRESYNTEVVFTKEWTSLVRLLVFHNRVKTSVEYIGNALVTEKDQAVKKLLEQRLKRLEVLRQEVHLQMNEKTLVAGRNYSKAWMELELAVRSELERANTGKRARKLDPDDYRRWVEKSTDEIERL